MPMAIPSTLEERIRASLGRGCGAATLLHGPAGCGKTEIARSLAAQLPWPVHFLDVQKQTGGQPGSAEAKALGAGLMAAKMAAPCVVVIDELDALAPATVPPSSIESHLALQLAEGLQELRGYAVFALGICREPNSVHPAVRRSGRLHHELAVRAPLATERADILEALAARLLPPADTAAGQRMRSVVRAIGREAHGLHGAQLLGLCQDAAMASWRRHAVNGERWPAEEEWWAALETARSTALRVLHLPTAGITPNSGAGPAKRGKQQQQQPQQPSPQTSRQPPGLPRQHESKELPTATEPTAGEPSESDVSSDGRRSSRAEALEALRCMPSGSALLTGIVAPLNSPSAHERLGVPPPRGVLLHGPAGCGKTSLARLVASAAAANFVEIHAAHLISPALGASEAALARLFAAARQAAPCVLFIDGLEALAPHRGADTTTEGTMDRLLSLLLTEIDGALRFKGPPVVLLGATRDRHDLDPAILRPGRLDVHVAIGPPDAAHRAQLLRRMLSQTPVAWASDSSSSADGTGSAADTEGDVSLPALVQLSAGFSLAQLSALCREAAMEALREQGLKAPHVRVRAPHFHSAVEMGRRRTSS